MQTTWSRHSFLGSFLSSSHYLLLIFCTYIIHIKSKKKKVPLQTSTENLIPSTTTCSTLWIPLFVIILIHEHTFSLSPLSCSGFYFPFKTMKLQELSVLFLSLASQIKLRPLVLLPSLYHPPSFCNFLFRNTELSGWVSWQILLFLHL